jgi:hypothetical protein
MRRRHGGAGRCRRSDMTHRIRDCQRCGRGVGKPERDLRSLPLGSHACPGQTALCMLWGPTCLAAGQRSLRALLSHLPALRRAGAVHRPRPVQGVHSAKPPGRQPSRVPTLRETQGSAARDRLVRIVLTPWSAAESGRGVCRLRAGDPTRRRWAVPVLLATLAAPDLGARIERCCGSGSPT